jgi:hypothetical protein
LLITMPSGSAGWVISLRAAMALLLEGKAPGTVEGCPRDEHHPCQDAALMYLVVL